MSKITRVYLFVYGGVCVCVCHGVSVEVMDNLWELNLSLHRALEIELES